MGSLTRQFLEVSSGTFKMSLMYFFLLLITRKDTRSSLKVLAVVINVIIYIKQASLNGDKVETPGPLTFNFNAVFFRNVTIKKLRFILSQT